jgi:hypothetical protein
LFLKAYFENFPNEVPLYIAQSIQYLPWKSKDGHYYKYFNYSENTVFILLHIGGKIKEADIRFIFIMLACIESHPSGLKAGLVLEA